MTARQPSQGLFVRILRYWKQYRRIVLLVLTASGLTTLISLLSPDTRNYLLTSIWANRRLMVLLLSFNLLTLSLLWSAGQRLDIWGFKLLNVRGHHPLWMDRLMWVITQIGNGIVGILLCVVLYLTGEHLFAIEMLLGILSLWLMVESVKAIVERTRPFIALDGTRVIGWKERGKSFPSGHTSQAFFMMALIYQHYGAGIWFSFFIYLTAILVGFTRIYVGAHYPRDVIGGAILGSVWGMIGGLIEVYVSSGI